MLPTQIMHLSILPPQSLDNGGGLVAFDFLKNQISHLWGKNSSQIPSEISADFEIWKIAVKFHIFSTYY